MRLPFASGFAFYVGLLVPLLHPLQVAATNCDVTRLSGPTDGVYNLSTTTVNDRLNVHFVPHTHLDAGWVRTYDNYFVRTVEYILDNVIDQLQHDPRRRFMMAEQGFFQRWWKLQTPEKKALVKQLVKEGRLDLSTHGAWVMHDEAVTHYTAMVDQTALGHEAVYRDFGVIPRIGWQIDPFGHSNTQGSLLTSGMGYDAIYFSRMDDQDYVERRKTKAIEWIWQASASRGAASRVFTGDMQVNYLAPRGLHFRKGARVDDVEGTSEFNVCEIVDRLVKISQSRMQYQRGNHIFFPMGDDFEYKEALDWFKGMDKLMHYANQDGRIHVLYSTMPYYTQMKNEESLSYPLRTDDLFPYSNRMDGYWTGYYTSRPTLKRFVRNCNVLLQQLRQLEFRAAHQITGVQELREEVAVLQHHDGITGTEKAHVAHDYTKRLYQAVQQAEVAMNGVLTEYDTAANPFHLCLLLNISRCDVTQSTDDVEVLLYNPLPRELTTSISVPIAFEGVSVEDLSADNKEIQHAVLPTTKVYNGHMGEANREVIFPVTLPPFGVKTYYIRRRNASPTTPVEADEEESDMVVIENDLLRVEFSKEKSAPIAFVDKKTNLRIPFHVSAMYYNGAQNNRGQSSGAYIFLPADPKKKEIPTHGILSQYHSSGVVQRVTVSLGEWGTLEYQLNGQDSNLEVRWTIGPIDVADKHGKEVVIVFDTEKQIKTEGEWFTDSNGLEFMPRKRDHRKTWTLKTKNGNQRVTANYVPMTTGVYIKDAVHQLNIITDRAQGVSSLEDGQVEVMVHRRLLYDDKRAVHEPLSENETMIIDGKEVQEGLRARGSFLVNLNAESEGMKAMRKTMERAYMEPLVAVRKASEDPPPTPQKSEQLSVVEFPENIGVATVQVLEDSCYLMRLTHLFAIHEDEALSKPVEIDFQKLITHPAKMHMTVDEMALSGVAPLEEVSRPAMEWKIDAETMEEMDKAAYPSTPLHGSVVSLQAMEVRAFRLCFPTGNESGPSSRKRTPLPSTNVQQVSSKENQILPSFNALQPTTLMVLAVLTIGTLVGIFLFSQRRQYRAYHAEGESNTSGSPESTSLDDDSSPSERDGLSQRREQSPRRSKSPSTFSVDGTAEV